MPNDSTTAAIFDRQEMLDWLERQIEQCLERRDSSKDTPFWNGCLVAFRQCARQIDPTVSVFDDAEDTSDA